MRLEPQVSSRYVARLLHVLLVNATSAGSGGVEYLSQTMDLLPSRLWSIREYTVAVVVSRRLPTVVTQIHGGYDCSHLCLLFLSLDMQVGCTYSISAAYFAPTHGTRDLPANSIGARQADTQAHTRKGDRLTRFVVSLIES